MKFIGITGGVGAGKSAVLDYLATKPGVRVMLADEIAHELMEPGTDCYEQIRQAFPEHDIYKEDGYEFVYSFNGKSAMIEADKKRMQQVIYNLIDNAIKFSHDNSFIYVTVREKGEKAQISIKDSGSGISKEDIDKIWDRFYKSDASRGRDKKGSGLGLSIVKEIIQAHEEHIDVISTKDVGTEFIFTLPLDKK